MFSVEIVHTSLLLLLLGLKSPDLSQRGWEVQGQEASAMLRWTACRISGWPLLPLVSFYGTDVLPSHWHRNFFVPRYSQEAERAKRNSLEEQAGVGGCCSRTMLQRAFDSGEIGWNRIWIWSLTILTKPWGTNQFSDPRLHDFACYATRRYGNWMRRWT